MEKKVALVTGAGRRVGRAIALALIEDGFHVAAHAHGSVEVLNTWAANQQNVTTFAANLQESTSARGLILDVEAALGRLDLLVSSAAAFPRTPFDAMSAEDMDAAFDQVMSLNVKATYAMVHQARSLLKASRGSVIAVTCSSTMQPYPNYLPYVVSKGALLQMVRTLAIELKPVRVNAIAPGSVLLPESTSAEEAATLASRTLLGRIGEVGDVVRAVRYLNAAEFVTGEQLLVDGGATLAGSYIGE